MTNSLSMFFSSRLSIYYTHGLCKEKKCFISAILPIPVMSGSSPVLHVQIRGPFHIRISGGRCGSRFRCRVRNRFRCRVRNRFRRGIRSRFRRRIWFRFRILLGRLRLLCRRRCRHRRGYRRRRQGRYRCGCRCGRRRRRWFCRGPCRRSHCWPDRGYWRGCNLRSGRGNRFPLAVIFYDQRLAGKSLPVCPQVKSLPGRAAVGGFCIHTHNNSLG